MATDTNVSNLIINKLTKQQYESIQNPSDTELYLVPEEIDDTPTSGSENPVTSDGIYTALQDKADKVSGATNDHLAGLDSTGNLTDSGKAVDTSISSGSTSTNLPTSQAVENRITQAIQAAQVGAAIFKGTVNSGTDISGLTAYSKGWYWVVATAGTYAGQTCEVGDFIFCIADYNSAYSASDFSVIQNNIDMSVINAKADKVSGATDGNFAALDSNGNLTDSGVNEGDFVASDQGSLNSGKSLVVGNDGTVSPGTAPLSKLTAAIPFGTVDSTSTSTVLTATVNGITELSDGVCCYINNSEISSAGGWTLNVNGLGAKPVYCTLEQNSRTQSAFLNGYTMLFVYNSSRVTGGCWDMYYGGNGNMPLLENIYENYTCSAADTDNGYIYFMRVHPTSDNWYNPWYVHYTLEITTDRPECQGLYDITIGASGNTYHYRVFNRFYSASYLPTYYHLVTLHNSAAKYAERDTYPIRLGERIWSSYQATTRARTYRIKVYDYSGCSIEFPESIEIHGSFYNADHYGTLPTLDATKVGILDNYDANTIPYQYYEYYTNYKIHDASTPLYRYRICGFDSDNKLVPLTITDRANATQNVIFPTQVPIKVGNGMVWYGTTTTISTSTGRTAGSTIYRGYSHGNTPWYYTFNGIPQNNCTIYACGSYDAVNGEFYLDTTTTTSWYVCVPDTINQDTDLSQYFTEGMYYWMIGVMGSTAGYGAMYLYHPVYLFDGKELVSTDNLYSIQYSIQTPSRWNNQLFNKRSTYGKNSTEATIEKIMGMSLSWNQKALEYAVTNGTMATDDGITTVTPNSSDCRYILRTVSGSNNTTPVSGHLYLQTAIVKSDAPVAFGNINGGMVGNSPTFDFQEGDDFRRCSDIYLSTSGTASTIQMYSPTGDTFNVKEGSFMLFDLTEMFGKGHEPDIKKFFELFPREVYDYCNGRIIDSYNGQETITTYDNEGNQIDSIQVGSNTTLRSSCIDYDEINGTTKITRVGSVNLGDLTWVLYNASKKIFRCASFSDTYGADRTKGSATYVTMLCGGEYRQRTTDNSTGNLANRQFFLGGTSGDLYMCDTRYSTADAFAAAVDGVYLNFPLLTPVESTIEDIGTPSYKCSLDGTEEAVNARQSSLESTPTCTPFRCCMEYTPYNGGGGGGSSEEITELTHAEMVDLLDNSQLVAGHRYKITDYKCSLTNSVSDSYWSKRFDGLYVTAISEDTLDENATLSLNELLQPMTIDGNSFSIKYNKEACPVKYTVENIPELSDTETREILENYHYFDCTDPVGLRNATLENIASAGYTPYDYTEMYSVDIDGTTYYTKGNPSEMTAGAYSLLCSEGPGSNDYMTHINYYSVGVLVKNQDNSYSYTTDYVVLYDTGQTHTIEEYGYEHELKILCENKDYVAGDECYLYNFPFDFTYKGHYDTVTGDWVLTSIADFYHAIVEGDKHTVYGGMGSIYFMRDMNGNESVFDFKSRTTYDGNFYLGSSVFFNGTDTGYKIDLSSVSQVYDDLGDTNLYVYSSSNNRILSKSPHFDLNVVSVFHSYGTGQGGYIYFYGIEDSTFGDVESSPKNQITGSIHNCNFISGNLNDCLFISTGNGDIYPQTVVRDSNSETIIFGNGDNTRYLVDNAKLFSLSDVEMTDDNHTGTDVSYNTDYRYKYLEIPALTRIKIVPNSSTSRISDYSESSCLIDDEPHSGDSFGYADCVFIEGNTTRKGKFKIGDWNGSGDIEFITLERSYLCLNVYNQTEDQELGTDNVFYVNAGPKSISILDDEPGDGIAVGLLTILTSKEELLKNALDVAASGNVRRMTSQPATGMLPNMVYDLGTITSNTTFTMAVPESSDTANIWSWSFSTGSTAPTITWPAGITGWNGGTPPVISANKTYEVSVMNGIACIIEN